jgi:hypothetical protein
MVCTPAAVATAMWLAASILEIGPEGHPEIPRVRAAAVTLSHTNSVSDGATGSLMGTG